jgi:hypothetical protein
MIVKSILYFLPAFLMGILVVFWLLPSKLWENVLLKVGAGMLFGLGLRGVLFFFWIIAFPNFVNRYIWLEVFLSVLFMGLFIRKLMNQWDEIKKLRFKTLLKLDRYQLVFIVFFAVNFISFLMFMLMNPMGNFDAYSIWNLKAKAIFLNPHDLSAVLYHPTTLFFHSDYPLLLPMIVSQQWFSIGAITTRVPILLAIVFSFLTLMLVFEGVRILRDSSQALFASILLLGAPFLVQFGTSQASEMPLAAFLLASIIFVMMYFRKKNWQYAWLAGIMAGFAAWTKNEGIMYFLILGGSIGIITFFTTRKQLIANITVWIGGAIIPLAALLTFKTVFSPESEFFAGSPIGFLLIGERYWIIFTNMVNQLFHWGGWSLPLLFGYILYLLINKRTIKEGYEKLQIMYIGIFVVFALAGFFLTYLITPYPLEWQITYSIDRLFFQFYPVFILGMMLYTSSFQELHQHEQ